MTRGEIEEFSGVELNFFETDREEDWCRIGCIDGVAAADKEPNLESIWHDVSEEPKLNQWFLAQIGDGTFDTFVMAMSKNQDWKEWANGINIKSWAYIEELLPKGDKK